MYIYVLLYNILLKLFRFNINKNRTNENKAKSTNFIKVIIIINHLIQLWYFHNNFCNIFKLKFQFLNIF
jgi:hypothetical protein